MSRRITVSKHKNILRKIVNISFVIILAALLVSVVIYLFPRIVSLKEASVRDEMRGYIQQRGIVGFLIMLGIQIAQVVLSIIPGEPVEVLFGFIYGPWLGALFCLLGMALGSFLVFVVTRTLGASFMQRVENSGKYSKLGFLKQPQKRDTLIFLLFFLPGTPKDTLTYFAPFSGIELWRFLLISTIARIPSVITSTFAGDNIFAGDYLASVVIFGLTGIIGIFGIIVYNRFISKHDRKEHE